MNFRLIELVPDLLFSLHDVDSFLSLDALRISGKIWWCFFLVEKFRPIYIDEYCHKRVDTLKWCLYRYVFKKNISAG